MCKQPNPNDTFDHAAYLCFQWHHRGWTLRQAPHAMQYASLAQQDEFTRSAAPPFHFLWSMEHSKKRLVLYNKDRRGPTFQGLYRRTVEQGMRLPFPAAGCRAD